jgi:hypothetical protein
VSGLPVGTMATGFFMIGLGFVFGSVLGFLTRLWK